MKNQHTRFPKINPWLEGVDFAIESVEKAGGIIYVFFWDETSSGSAGERVMLYQPSLKFTCLGDSKLEKILSEFFRAGI